MLTGGAGFVGSHLAERLLAEGHSVVVVDNCSTGRLDNIKPLLTNDNLTFFKEDTVETLVLEGPVDAVCHLASPASPTDFPRIPVAILKAGSLGTMNALELARQKG
ncbi:MAG: GDP-mannose 4,6-dehydratase, partial [Planctomycetes bacterium]|nr:GDP-mannose 4,6-dehydratase [Planctomycetota bacterium]